MRVLGHIGAGSGPIEVDDAIVDGMVPCVEIKVGAPFPLVESTGVAFDACVPWEHATIVSKGGSGKVLKIDRPPLTAWHKRYIGGDFRKGAMILERGMLIMPKHVMALASVGILKVSVMNMIRIGVMATGGELATTLEPYTRGDSKYSIPDANGPYLTAALIEMGADAHYIGAIPDDERLLTEQLRKHLQSAAYDVIVTTGGVSRGENDYVPSSIKKLNGWIRFRQVAMQPGHAVIFATLPKGLDSNDEESPRSQQTMGSSSSRGAKWRKGSGSGSDRSPGVARSRSASRTTPMSHKAGETAYFALPGNPIASAACFRFIVSPYLRILSGMHEEGGIMAKAASPSDGGRWAGPSNETREKSLLIAGSEHVDIFRHGTLRSNHDGVSVQISKDKNTAKASPFATANCWAHVPRGHAGYHEGDVAIVYPFCSPKS